MDSRTAVGKYYSIARIDDWHTQTRQQQRQKYKQTDAGETWKLMMHKHHPSFQIEDYVFKAKENFLIGEKSTLRRRGPRRATKIILQFCSR